MKNKQLAGVFPYLVSPINPDGSVNTTVLRKLVDYLIDCGVHGLTPLGSTGEVAYLTWEQKKVIVNTVISSARGRVPVVAGVFSTSNREASRQAAVWESMGVDGILAAMGSYFPLQQKQIYSYFKDVAESVVCPVVLYNNPKFLKIDLNLEVIQDLAEIPNISYLKDASGNSGKLLTIHNTVGDKLKLFSASSSIPLFVMMLGGVGWMAGPACIAPRESVALYNLAQAKEWDRAVRLQKKIWEINHIFQKFNMAACIKAALEMEGFLVGNPVPPLLPLTPRERIQVEKVLRNLQKIHLP